MLDRGGKSAHRRKGDHLPRRGRPPPRTLGSLRHHGAQEREQALRKSEQRLTHLRNRGAPWSGSGRRRHVLLCQSGVRSGLTATRAREFIG
jgi:hypothetical protein